MKVRAPLITALAVAAGGGGLYASTAASGATTVGVKDDFFSPKSATVSKNATVNFRWSGRAPHNVTVTSGPVKFHSKTQTSGSYKRKLSKKGTYKFECTIHDGMTGKIRVK